MPYPWDRIESGVYRKEATSLVGLIERSETKWWWWMVFDPKTGKEKMGGRRLKLKDAQKSADMYLDRGHLKVVP